MSATKTTPTRRWLSTVELLEAQGISRSFLGQLLRNNVLKQGIHYRRLGVSSKSPMQWLEAEVEAALLTIASEPEALEVIN